MSKYLLICVSFVLFPIAAFANWGALPYQISTNAEYVYMMDFETQNTLLDKNADAIMHPASMTKLMTLYVTFEYLKAGYLKLNDILSVSNKAWKIGGSTMFLEPRHKVSIQKLIEGIAVVSGNDASIVLAEAISGSEEDFLKLMNHKASILGLTNTSFANVTGLPVDNHYSTARDIASLTRALIKEFPEYLYLFKIKELTFSGITQKAKNNLLLDNRVQGMKTGNTDESGYGVSIYAKNNKRGIIFVVNGLKSHNERTKEAKRLVNYGLRSFVNANLYNKGDTVDFVDIWLGGEVKKTALTLKKDVKLTLPINWMYDKTVKVYVKRKKYATLPLDSNDPFAKLIVEIDSSNRIHVFSLYPDKTLEELSLYDLFWVSLEQRIRGGEIS